MTLTDNARENVEKVFGNINAKENMVPIHTGMHVHLHTIEYKSAIVLSFKKGLFKQPDIVKSRLKKFKDFLTSVDKFFFGG